MSKTEPPAFRPRSATVACSTCNGTTRLESSLPVSSNEWVTTYRCLGCDAVTTQTDVAGSADGAP
jgi:hypothetical protein